MDWVDSETKGWFTSIDIFPDTDPGPDHSTWKVGVSYYDYSNDSLKYAEYLCPLEGYCNWTVSTVDSPNDYDDTVGQYTSMKFDSSGTPHIAYFASEIDDLDFLAYLKHATYLGSGAGNCGNGNNWVCEIVDGSFFTKYNGFYPSLDISWNDIVYISYVGSTGLSYAYFVGAGNGNCYSDAWLCQTNGDGSWSSMHAPQNEDDCMRVAYYSFAGRLVYAIGPGLSDYCGHSNGLLFFYIDDMGAGQSWVSISLAVDSNLKPIIAYTDASEDLAPVGLKVAEPASGPPYGTCAGWQPDWWCGVVDGGNQYVDEARYLSLGIKPDGLVMIAYSERERDYPGSYDLKFAYQNVWSFLPVTIK